MSRLRHLEQQVRALPPEEHRAFRRWFPAYDAERWDEELEEDAEAGRLDALVAEAIEELGPADRRD